MQAESKVKTQYLFTRCSAALFTLIHEKWPVTDSLLGFFLHAAWKRLSDVPSLRGWHHYASAHLLHLWVQHFSHKPASHLSSTLKAFENISFFLFCFFSISNPGINLLDILSYSNMLSKYASKQQDQSSVFGFQTLQRSFCCWCKLCGRIWRRWLPVLSVRS